ncbi:MAG: PhnD/SsuA/transferrin family substrate-binding protein [Lachnospiraceae bacterium]|nr:PhnD/SsuA/transferrin family substrate-binding protein [Lachnospiraceae bacterium]
MKKAISLTLSLLLCLGLLSGCGASETDTDTSAAETSAGTTTAEASGQETAATNTGDLQEIESLTIAFSPYADADTVITSTEPLEELLQTKLMEKGYDVQEIDMSVGTSYTAVGQALSAGSADIGFISGGNYVLFSDDCDVLLTALRYAISKDSEDPADWNDGTLEENTDEMSTYYRSVLLAGPSEKGQELLAKVNAGEELTWEDLGSATWAVMDATSASGYIYPSLWLQERYGKTIADLSNVVESDSYTTSLSRLAAGQVDIIVSYGHIRVKYASDWVEEFGGTDEMVNQTGILGVSEPIYNDMIAYSEASELMADENFRQALGEAFIEIAETEEGKEIISVFSQIGYEWGDDANYDGEREAQELLKSLES